MRIEEHMRQGIDEEHIQRGTADVMEGSPSVFDVHRFYAVYAAVHSSLFYIYKRD
jgi:hypothetical protein